MMKIPTWMAKHFYMRSLMMDNHDPPLGGYAERLERRIGRDEAEKFMRSTPIRYIVAGVALSPLLWGIALFFFLLARAMP